MNHIEAMEQWLYALEMGRDAAFQAAEMFHLEMRGYKQQRHEALDAEVKQIDEAITTLRTAIEAAEKQEPASLTYKEVTDTMNALRRGTLEQQQIAVEMENKKLYTTPPAAQRQWVGLTEDELGELMKDSCGYPMCPNGDDLAFARAIEAKLKEKNT